MNIYHVKNEDPDRYDSLLLAGGRYDQVDFFGKRARGWKPIGVKIYEMRERADLYELGGNPVASQSAWQLLRPLLSDHVQVLPIRRGAEELKLLNVTTVSTSFDERRSKVDRFPSGGIMRVERYAFDTKKISSPIFRLKNLEAKGVFCTDELRDVVDRNGLHGWRFEQVAGSKKPSRVTRATSDDGRSLLNALLQVASSRGETRMPARVANVYHATVLDREVLNGGFSQYLWNTRGKTLSAARRAVDELEISAASTLLDQVAALWSDRKLEHRAFFRSGVFGARSGLANDLDKLSRRYARVRADLAVMDYVESHAEELKKWVEKRPPARPLKR